MPSVLGVHKTPANDKASVEVINLLGFYVALVSSHLPKFRFNHRSQLEGPRDCLTLENQTDRLYRNVCKWQPTNAAQKSTRSATLTAPQRKPEISHNCSRGNKAVKNFTRYRPRIGTVPTVFEVLRDDQLDPYHYLRSAYVFRDNHSLRMKFCE